MLDKRILRRQALENLRQLTTKQRAALMLQLPKAVARLEKWKLSQVVALPVSQAFEIPTNLLIQIALQQHKTVVVPRVKTKTMMEFIAITPETIYSKSKFGILEPVEGTVIAPNAIDFFVVPGLFFSADGQRIGFGGGYYDRYLERSLGYRLGVTIELNWKLKADWDVEVTDQGMDQVIKLAPE